MKNFFLISILILGLFGANSVQAFSISPLKFTATLGPGDTKDWEVKVTNNSNQPSTFFPVVIGMKQDIMGRSIFDKNIDVAESWFKTPIGSISLAPGESANEIFSISVPANTPPGAHYLGLAIQEKNDQVLSAQLATVLNLQISGLAKESLLLEKFLISKKIFLDKNWLAEMQMKNIGNVSVNLEGKAELYYFQQKFSEQSVNLGNAVFAQSVRSANLNYFPNNKMAWPGFYRGDITVIYGATHQTTAQSVNFWYFPRWFFVVFGLIILLIIVFVFKKNKNVAV